MLRPLSNMRIWFGAVVGLLLMTTPSPAQTTYTWTGASAVDSNWFTPENWLSGGVPTIPVSDINNTFLELGGTTRTTNVLDFSLSANRLFYNDTAGPFVTSTATGEILTLGSGGVLIATGNTNNQAFNAGLTLGATQSWTNNGTGVFTAGGPLNLGANGLTFNGTGNSLISGQITGSGPLALTGPSTLTINNSTNSSTFSGGITVSNGGVLSYTNQLALGTTAGSGVITLDGGTLRNTVSGNAGTFSPVNRNIVLNAGGGTLEWDSAVATNLIIVQTGTVISGVGGLTKAGNGIISIVTPATYSGPTVVAAGTLRTRTNSNVLPVATALTVNAGATFDIGANLNQRVGSLTGAGTVNIPGGIFTVGNANSTTFTGAITGNATGRFVKEGAGTLTLAGTNSYGGATTLNAGTLALASSGSLAATSAVTVNINATLAGTGTINGTTTIAGGGAVRGGVAGSPGTLNFNNNLTINSTASNNGILRVEANRTGDNAATASLLNVAGTGILNLNPGANVFTIDLVSGSTPLAFGENYTLTLASVATAGNIQLNGVSLGAGEVIDSSRYVLRSDSFADFTGTTLFVNDARTALLISFTPVPEPTTVLLLAGGALAVSRAARRRFLA